MGAEGIGSRGQGDGAVLTLIRQKRDVGLVIVPGGLFTSIVPYTSLTGRDWELAQLFC